MHSNCCFLFCISDKTTDAGSCDRAPIPHPPLVLSSAPQRRSVKFGKLQSPAPLLNSWKYKLTSRNKTKPVKISEGFSFWLCVALLMINSKNWDIYMCMECRFLVKTDVVMLIKISRYV